MNDLTLPSTVSDNEATDFINERFRDLKNKNKIKIVSLFSFTKSTPSEIENLIASLDSSSSPGASGIPVKVIKYSNKTLSPTLSNLFNHCFETGSMPAEFKKAIVTPLYKRKGEPDNFDNYRGISVLSPIAKTFSRCMSTRIISFFESNNLFSSSQHGFRKNFSCETALLTIIDKWKLNMSNKLFNLALFIDFKKAFDLINLKLFQLKLFHYGFDNKSLKLINDYFTNRTQVSKVGSATSEPAQKIIGFPQGDPNGQLFFLIYINDIFMSDSELTSVLFADDTTGSDSNADPGKLIASFKLKIVGLIHWVKMSQMTINWSKTKAMFITKRHTEVEHIKSIHIDGFEVEVVKKFKLLGIMIDHTLSFNDYLIDLKKKVNTKLYSIKKIFYLSLSVKVQFFKSFILPHFDYCLSLVVFLSKRQIEKLTKFYNVCLLRLLDVKIFDYSDNEQLIALKKFNLLPFKMRICYRLNLFCFKILNNLTLKNFFSNLKFKASTYSLRQNDLVETAKIRTNYGRLSLSYFLPRFINNVIRHSYQMDFKLFKQHLNNNLLTIFTNYSNM